MNKIVDYYNTEYNEDERLGQNCDNRHYVEREVKKHILQKFIKNTDSILDVGAGTGLYSLFFAEKGNLVTAGDIVPKHVDLINQKAKERNLKINTMVLDAGFLPFKDNSFDVVLLAGPIYHVDDLNLKKQYISEAVRVCKKGGTVVVDYLSDIHGFIQHCLIDKSFLANSSHNDFVNRKCKDVTFSYDNAKKIRNLMLDSGLNNIKIFGTDSITRFIREDINSLNEENIKKWVDFIISISEEQSIIDLSEHCIAIANKIC